MLMHGQYGSWIAAASVWSRSSDEKLDVREGGLPLSLFPSSITFPSVVISDKPILPILLLLLFVALPARAGERPSGWDDPPRNIIVFIADGAGPSHFTMGRELARSMGLRDGLYLDPYQVGSVRTYSAKERVTDSASSATAYASGIKTYNGAIGVDTLRRPVQTLIEVAERRGMATGMVVTSRITHATPAAFAAHVEDRGMEDAIADQEIRQGIEVVFGGGRRFFLPPQAGGDRKDERDLLAAARAMGYTVVEDPAQFEGVDSTPVLGLFANDHMPYEIDRLDEPHLELRDMTRKALELLSGGEEGFFLLVEGSRIDHASHDNDPAASLREVIAYDDAFQAALEYARADGRTLVVALSDHSTGGISAGRAIPRPELPTGELTAPTFWRSFYGKSEYDWKPAVLAAVRNSTAVISEALGDPAADARAVMRGLAGIGDLSEEETEALAFARREGHALKEVIGEIISRRARVGWTTGAHTAVDVNLYAYGPGSEALRGNMENNDIGRYLLGLLGADVALLSAGKTP